MKRTITLLTIALIFAGCSGLPTLSYPPPAPGTTPAPIAVPAIPPQVAAIIALICSSPAATADPKVAAGCMVLPLLTPPAAK